jgi:probable HAF family extracellular repeat protein
MTRSSRLCAFALLVGALATNDVCAAGPSPDVAIYHIVDLGAYFYPKDLNNRGEVAGQPLDEPVDRAGFVLRGGRWQPLPRYHNPPVGPRAINDRGDVAGDGFGTVGFWPRGSEFMPVPLPPDATGGGGVTDISDHQVIIGNFFIGSEMGACFRWSAAEGSIDLGKMGSGDFCNVSAINDSGQIVGRANIEAGGEPHAFLWENGIFQDLIAPDGQGGFFADDINREGHVIGGPFLWKNGKMIDLRVGTPYYAIIAESINDRDEIAGQAYYTYGPEHAVLIAGGHIIELETVVDALHDWKLTDARFINNLGEIVGLGFRTGDHRSHSFMLVPIP